MCGKNMGLKKLWVQKIVGKNHMLGVRILSHKQIWILKRFVVPEAIFVDKIILVEKVLAQK